MTTPADYVGDLRRIRVDFADIAGTPGDPAAVTLTVLQPDGVKVAKDLSDGVVNDTAVTGGFYYDFPITQAGRHFVRWAGTGGAPVAAVESEFYARRKQTG